MTNTPGTRRLCTSDQTPLPHHRPQGSCGITCGTLAIASIVVHIGEEEGKEAIHLCLRHLVWLLMHNGVDPNAVFDGLSAMIADEMNEH